MSRFGMRMLVLAGAVVVSSSAMANVTLTFKEGANGYSGNQDTHVRQADPTTNYGSELEISVDGGDPTPNQNHGLVRFDNIFGMGDGKLRLGWQIVKAEYVVNITSAGTALNLHRLLRDWSQADATWNSLTDGISADGVEAEATPFLTTPFINAGEFRFDVTSAVQAWSDGATNYGFVFLPTGTNGVDWDTSESLADFRPQLIVEAVPEPGTLLALAAGAGVLLRRKRK